MTPSTQSGPRISSTIVRLSASDAAPGSVGAARSSALVAATAVGDVRVAIFPAHSCAHASR